LRLAGALFGVVALVGSHEAEVKGQIVLHNLYYRYAPSEPEVLRGVSVLIDGQPLSRAPCSACLLTDRRLAGQAPHEGRRSERLLRQRRHRTP